MLRIIGVKLSTQIRRRIYAAGLVKFSLIAAFFSYSAGSAFAQVAPLEKSERQLGVYRNPKLSNMSAKEFYEVFEQGKIKQGSSFEDVENSLGRPTEVKTARTGATTWIYDGSALAGSWGNAGFSRAGRFNYAIIVFNAEGLVTQLRYRHVE